MSKRIRKDIEGRLVLDLDDYLKPEDGRHLAAVPQDDGNYLKGYVWVGNKSVCYGYVDTSDFLRFADEIRKLVKPKQRAVKRSRR